MATLPVTLGDVLESFGADPIGTPSIELALLIAETPLAGVSDDYPGIAAALRVLATHYREALDRLDIEVEGATS